MLSCSSQESQEISDEELVSLLFDLQVSKIAIQSYEGEEDLDTLAKSLHAEVLARHELSEVELEKIRNELRNTPERLNDLYEKVGKLVDSLRIDRGKH